MGTSSSTLNRGLESVDSSERFYGLENFGNTCYCNSVLQALFFCKRFREQVISFAANVPPEDRDQGLLFALADLFQEIVNQEKRQGQVSPSRFIQTVRQRDRRFRNTAHQDAQEFLNFTLDALVEVIQKFQQRRAQSNAACQSESMGHRNGVQDSVRRDLQSATTPVTGYSARCSESGTAHGQGDSAGSIRVQATPAEQRSFVHDIFCGKTVTHTRCMNCEAQSKREENFMELTLDIEQQDTTLEQCMLAFSKRELLDADNKFHCSSCNSYQEAQKWVDIKTCPPVLIIHLNRLAFLHHLGREQKVKHRVVFGDKLTPPNMAEGSEDAQYRLYAVIVHMGTSAAHGHYVSYIQVQGKWFYFDDAQVEMASQSDIEGTFGQASEWTFGNDSHAYLLFYQLVERESQETPGSNPSDTPDSSDGPAPGVVDAMKQRDDGLHKSAAGPDRV